MDAPFRQYLGWERFPENLTEPEVAHFFSLSEDDRRAVHRRRRPLNRLGVALQVGFLRLTGAPLNSVEMIPSQVLAHLGAELGIAPPRLTSIRALYRRHRTLFEHQDAAKQALGLRDLTEHGERALNGFLRREASDKFLVDELEQAARAWLRDHHYVQLPTRRLRSSASGARRHHDGGLLAGAVAAVGMEQTKAWPLELSETMPNGKTRLEWLRDSPASRKTKGLANHIAKIDFLKKLGADRLQLGLAAGMLKAQARSMLYRKPATLKRMRGERKTIEIACFLRLQLLRLTDDGLGMIDYRIADLWRQARTRAEAAVEDELRRHQALVLQLASLVDDENTSASVVRDQMRIMLAPFLPAGAHGPSTKVGRVRRELATAGRGASELLGAAASISLDLPSTHPLAQALATLDRVAASEMGRLPEGTANPFGRTWALLIDQPDREAAFGSYRAAALMLLKRSLRNGQASVDHSLEHRAPEDRLIPKAQWQKERARFVRNLAVSAKPEATIRWIKDELTTALKAIDAAVSRGDIRIENDRLVVPKLKAAPEDERLKGIRRELFAGVGKIQLPDLLIAIDATTHFSWALLGRSPRSEHELITLYAALIALGSDLTAADMARMTLNIEADAVGEMMRRIEANGRLPAANRLVLDHFRTLPVTRLWGGGIQASADMMSLDATRRLWTARHDPRRRTPAVGTYTHVLDQWVILHDQAVVLNRRQAGAAIEGALRHEAVDLHRVAVDTHGHTHFGMALANLVGFDLAPRLAGMNKRKLYLPRGLDVPASLRPIVSETVSTGAITRGWDPLLRIAASTKSGWCSATYVLDRFGSAARGDEAFQAGDAFGRLLLTRFLGAYLGDPAFRAMNDALLSQGESVHTLQRAIYSGPIGARHGRTPEQMAAISSGLTLLTNVIMTWNATRIGEVRARMPDTFPDHHIMHIAPNAHEHINTKGVITIDVSPHRDRLLGEKPPVAAIRSVI
ncbi:Tn3 family transposase [Sphingobium sp. TB-6]|uniref:Tn3 family transposase n=1 Tax=Sphingobium sp. TB-6 TaxID=2728850 RepID=UPI00146C23A8|nr:Tn3 family transposase [Sphingobium sp. TB-6]